MAFRYRSAFPAFLLIVLGPVAACEPLGARVETFEIRAHSIESSPRCRIASNPDIELEALGPFPVRGTERVAFRSSDRTLSFPDETRGVEARVTEADATWIGYAEQRSAAGIDVLLWRRGVGCELSVDDVASDYPGPNAGQAIGYSPESGIVLVAGSDSEGSAAAGALAFDSGTGVSPPVELSFPEARAYATVTPFGSGLLLAGGEKPLDTDFVPDRETRESAAFYDPGSGGFDADLIELELGRTRHAAVVTPSGETLLVGGARATRDGMVLVTQFEIVSPRTRRSTVAGVTMLANGRMQPSALMLDNGRLLVGGGYDENQMPVTSLEWFSSDGSCAISPGDSGCTGESRVVDLTLPRHHRAFAATPGGGALTVGGCEPAAEQDTTCETACGAGFGCPATTSDVRWIAPNGDITDVAIEASGECGALVPERALFAAGSDGAPWLLAYDLDVVPPCRAAYRFNAWNLSGPTFESVEPAAFDPVLWPDPRTALTSIGSDAFVWLTEAANEDSVPLLVGLRASARGALSQYETNLLFPPPDSDQRRPVHLSPERAPKVSTAPKAMFTPEWRLILEPPNAQGPIVPVHVTDTRYDDVAIALEFSPAGPPILLLGAFEVGVGDCRWPETDATELLAVRRGTRVTLSDDAGARVTCRGAPKGPITISLRAGPTGATLSSIVIRRL